LAGAADPAGVVVTAATGTPAIGLTDLPRLPAGITDLGLVDDAFSRCGIAREALIARRLTAARATVDRGAAGVGDGGAFAGAGLGSRLRDAARLRVLALALVLSFPLVLALLLALAFAVVFVLAGVVAGFAPVAAVRTTALRVLLGGRSQSVREERGKPPGHGQLRQEPEQAAARVRGGERLDEAVEVFSIHGNGPSVSHREPPRWRPPAP
jgi:hypothetical protein